MFFSSGVISAKVLVYPSGWKMGSHPKLVVPLGFTIVPGTTALMTTGSFSGDAYPIQQMAWAVLSGKLSMILGSSANDSACSKSLM